MAVADRERAPGRVPPLFGRGELHDALVRALEEARTGSGKFLLLVGTRGIGKSTLLHQAVADARERGFLALSARALPSDVPAPFAVVRDLLRALREGEAARDRPAGPEPSILALFLAPFEPDRTGRASGEDGPAGPRTDVDHLLAYLTGPPARVEESRVMLFDRLADFFVSLTEKEPLLLAVDDLQFADDSSLEFLESLAQATPRSRVALIGTLVPPEEAPPRGVHRLERLLAAERTSRLDVRPMTEPEVAEYVRWILNGRDPGREAVLRWYTQTEGNPLFVEYVARNATAPAGASPSGSRGLDAILRERLGGLPEPDRRVIVYATVLGKEFDFPTLAVAASGQEEERLAESVDRLVHAGLLREKGGEVYEFVSERVRAEAYAQLTETRRRILHRKVAQAIEARGRSDPATVYELARQYYLAREDGPAVAYNARAAELASRAFAHEASAIYLERALEGARRQPQADPTLELHLMVELGRVLDENEEFRRSEEVLLRAVERARAAPGLETELALALLWLARTRSDLGEFSPARHLAREAQAILDRLGHQRGLLVAHRVLGIACWRLGEYEPAEKHQREELALAEREQDSREKGHALIDLANTLVSVGGERLSEAQALYEAAARIFSEGQEETAQARVWMNLALLHHGRGDLAQGYAALEKAISAAERSHSRIWIGYCRMNQAQFNVEQGRVAEARGALERSASMLEPLGDQFAHQQLTMIEGMLREGERNFVGAEEAFAEAIRLARDLHFEAEAVETQFRSARLALRRGEPRLARERFEAARAAGLYRLKGDLASEADALDGELSRAGAPGRSAPS